MLARMTPAAARLGEGPDRAIAHPHAHFGHGRRARTFLDLIAGIAAAYRAGHSCQGTAIAAANVIAQQSANHRSRRDTQATAMRCRTLIGVGGDDSAAIRTARGGRAVVWGRRLHGKRRHAEHRNDRNGECRA